MLFHDEINFHHVICKDLMDNLVNQIVTSLLKAQPRWNYRIKNRHNFLCGRFFIVKIGSDSMNRAYSGDKKCPIPTYGLTHAKVQKSIFNSKILELILNIGVILNDF